MAFYSIQPSELAALDEADRRGLSLNMPRIAARKRLEFILDIMAAMPSDSKGVSHYLQALVAQAYGDEPEDHAVILEALTRS